MVKTGYISFISETGGGFDSNGNAIAATKIGTMFVPCNILVITREYKTYADGEFRQAKYSVIVDRVYISSFNLTNCKEVQLQDILNADLGIFQIQNKETLVLSNQLKIIV